MTQPTTWNFERTRSYILAFLIGTLSVTVLLKIGEVQYLEIILAADFLILIALFIRHRLRVKVFEPFFSIGQSYVIFLTLALLFSVFALNQNFYAYNFTFFKRPLLLTVSRMAELTLDVSYMLYMASLYRENEKLCRFGASIYYWMAVAGGLYAVVTFPLNFFFEAQLGTYSVSHRLRGFNNEGGSYGTYMVTVCLLTVAMYHRKWLTRRQYLLSMALFLICLIGSQSKAAFFVVVAVAAFHFLLTQTGWRRWTLVATGITAFTIVGIAVDIPAQVNTYLKAAAVYQKVSLLRPTDGNYVMGRVSGVFLAPRMIESHPLLGIGWGNYPLVRDDPEYRRGTAFSIGNVDSPSLGPIDYIVELGFPLWLYLTWVMLKPVYLLYRRRADPWLLSLALMQPLSNWFGAHLNLTYPWVVVGLALGMGFTNRAGSKTHTATESPAESPS